MWAGRAAFSGVRTHSAYCAEDFGDSQGAAFGWFESTVEVPQTQFFDGVASPLRTETEILQVQFLDKVVASLVVLEGCSTLTVVDVPVVMQSCSACVVYGGFWTNFTRSFYVKVDSRLFAHGNLCIISTNSSHDSFQRVFLRVLRHFRTPLRS